MEYEQFRCLVRQMRDAQAEYFKDRNLSALERSKRLERMVDNELRRDQQPELDL